MLKNLLSELGKSLKRGSPEKVPEVDLLTSWKATFPNSNAVQRAELMSKLNSWIAQHAERKQGWNLRGDWLLRLGDLVQAEQDYRRALTIDPMSPAAQEGLGLVLLQAGRLDEAYLHLELAHKVQPMNSEVLTHWGLVALEMGNFADAHSKFERAVERDVRNPHAWHNLGLVATKRGQTNRGIEYLQRAIDLKPDLGLAHSNIALAFRDAERLDEAIVAARRAAELKPDNARVWVVLGDVLIDAGAFEEAEQALRRAQTMSPNLPAAQIALGKLYAAWHRPADSEHAYLAALASAPANAEAEGGLGQLELLLGRFASGWDHYEARKRTDNAPVRSYPFMEWQGDDLSNRTLLVHSEQGLGDIILFASCLPDVIARAGHVVVQVPPRLAGLFAHSFPEATVVGREPGDSSLDWLNGLPAIERHSSIGSLPRWLRRGPESFPVHGGYLRAEPRRVEQWRERFTTLGDAPKIGIAWRGGLLRSGGAQRSIALNTLVGALVPLRAQLISLQYGDAQSQVDAASASVHHWPEALIDQADAAALTCAVDAVVTVCSTQAHLTGALGRPGCVLVPANPNWRYGLAGRTTPWYPSLELARQSELDDWTDALAEAVSFIANRLPR